MAIVNTRDQKDILRSYEERIYTAEKRILAFHDLSNPSFPCLSKDESTGAMGAKMTYSFREEGTRDFLAASFENFSKETGWAGLKIKTGHGRTGPLYPHQLTLAVDDPGLQSAPQVLSRMAEYFEALAVTYPDVNRQPWHHHVNTTGLSEHFTEIADARIKKISALSEFTPRWNSRPSVRTGRTVTGCRSCT
jgi:hypothetical protein